MDTKEIYTKLLYSTIDHKRDHGLYDNAQLREVVRHLIELGADVTYVKEEKYPWTLLHGLIPCYDFELIKILLDAGIDIDAKDCNGETALFHAADCSKLLLVQLLIENSADINTRNNNGRTILYAAAMRYQPDRELIKFLIDKGLDINAVDSDNRTPLQLLCERVDREYPSFYSIKLLIELGADVNVKDNEGNMPSDILEELIIGKHKEEYEEVLNLLRGKKNG